MSSEGSGASAAGQQGRGAPTGSSAPICPTKFPRYRAPSEDGQALFAPPWDDLPALVAANRDAAARLDYDLQGESLSELRKAARYSLFHHLGLEAIDQPLVLSGHQPELFHPGVWLKNFALGGLAERVGGAGVNLVIDSDLCRAASIKVPTGDALSPRVERVAYDASATPVPYEERGVVDAGLLESFPQRVAAALGGLVDRPLVHELWPSVIETAQRMGNLGAAITQGRHRLESVWGNATSECPMSIVCDASPFRWFAADLLTRLEAFHAAHNGALAEYRAAHNIRTPAQPLPDLHTRDGWLETPLWVWTVNDPTRRPLYAKPRATGLVLSDLGGGEWTMDASGDSLDALAGQLALLRFEYGVKIRSRALVTTLFGRLLLADLFLHGIGGAKYDQVTDRLAERFYGFAPPPHATLSATLRLPIEHERADPNASRRIAAELRSLEYHAEHHLAGEPAAQAIIEEKRRWITTPKTPDNAAERHRAITQANAALQPLVEPQRQTLRAKEESLADHLRAARVLDSREYAFCLFPEHWLRPRLLGMVPTVDRTEWR